MKKLVLLFAAVCPLIALAQDKIITKKGETIAAKVLEISTDEVKYKKADNLKGPTYIAQKAELQAIEYENGAKEVYSTTTAPKSITIERDDYYADGKLLSKKWELEEVLKNDPEAYRLFRKSNAMNTISKTMIFSSAGLGLATLIVDNNTENFPSGFVYSSLLIGGFIPGMVISLTSSNRFDEAIEVYNRNQQKNITLSPIIGTNSIGVAIKFWY